MLDYSCINGKSMLDQVLDYRCIYQWEKHVVPGVGLLLYQRESVLDQVLDYSCINR